MKATNDEMKAARLDIAYRDYCAHLLIPLNKCRHETFYLPWKCGHERHTYEKCQYVECVMPVAVGEAAALAQRSSAAALAFDCGAVLAVAA